MSSADSESKKWWNTLPGILTGIATLITAIGGIIVILNSNGCFERTTHVVEQEEKVSPSTMVFVEDFSNNSNGWYQDTTDDHEIGILNGHLYVYCKGDATNAGRTSVFSNISLEKYFPSYEVNLLCNFISGDTSLNSPFGFILTNEDYNEYYQFCYYRNGFGNASYVRNDSIIVSSYINGALTKKRQAKLTLRVVGDEYKYYINNIKVVGGKLESLKLFTIRLFASRTQTIGFDKLEIRPF